MPPLDALLRRVLAAWRGAGVAIRPGVSAERLAAWEHARGTALPVDVASFYRCVDGMTLGDWDAALIRFLPLDELCPLPEELGDAASVACGAWLVFADYSIWAHAYAVRTSGADLGAVSLAYDRQPPALLAPSFVEFLASYLTDPLRWLRIRR